MRLGPIALCLAALAACAAPAAPPASRAATCEALFRDFEREVRFGDAYRSAREDRPSSLRSEVSRLARRIIGADCLTFGHDLGDLVGLRIALAGRVPPLGGAAAPVAVQAGVVAGIGEEIATLQFFRGLGYGARSLDAPGLGRRIYVGPLTSPAEVEEVLALSRRAGFVAPFVSETFRFGFTPSLL